jgi:hypothetical protein
LARACSIITGEMSIRVTSQPAATSWAAVGSPGSAADVQHPPARRKAGQQQVDQVPLAVLVGEHLVGPVADLVERGGLGLLPLPPATGQRRIDTHTGHS